MRATAAAPNLGVAPPLEVIDAGAAAVNGKAPAAKPVDAVYAAHRRRKRPTRVTAILGTVAIVLLIVLVIVLTRFVAAIDERHQARQHRQAEHRPAAGQRDRDPHHHADGQHQRPRQRVPHRAGNASR